MEAYNPWVMVIEALLHTHQLDITNILELMKMVKETFEEADRNFRELLSVRILESLYAQEIRNSNGRMLLAGPLITIDSSHSCEDVVNGILQLASLVVEAHILELDVPSFILQKLSNLQSCYLLQLKNRILEGSSLILGELENGSGLEVPEESSRVVVDEGISGSIISGSIADKHGVARDTECKLTLFKVDDGEVSEEGISVKNLSPAKRKRILDVTSGGSEHALEPPPITVNVCGENIEENGSTEGKDIKSDIEEYHDVRTDIEMLENASLSSQGIDNQVSLGTQLTSCVKCNKDGNLLVCSSSGCQLVVHEECLGSAIDFYRTGDFYCPFCAYSQAISCFLEAKKNLFLARRNRRAFHVFLSELEEKSSSKRSEGSKKHTRRNICKGNPSKN
ncbi:hypothetical protein LIER_00103 [Lithospermum erythrorhizon]|uniref:Zinc finger PHD-type domain-containing protein n=1 Tax=Lithospermum erythrorhizon TaxID=34254 RepID=A0AAV3NGC7_LITER